MDYLLSDIQTAVYEKKIFSQGDDACLAVDDVWFIMY